MVALADLAAAAPVEGPWKFKAGMAVKAGYDSNVYLQDTEPSPTVAHALPANRGSVVTRLVLNTTTSWANPDTLKLAFDYNPEIVRFHSASGENHMIHLASLTVSGGRGSTVWALHNQAKWIDGSDEGPIYGGPGGAPALGGIPVRDRRDAMVDVGSLQLTHTREAWMVRPSITVYRHDFGIQQRATAGYVNFIDRSELLGGVDLGYEVVPKTRLIAGFRWGSQQQYKLLGVDSPYDSTVRRFLVGLEGEPIANLKLNLLAGPESRSYASGTPAGFDRNNQPLWISLAGTWIVAPKNEVTVFYTYRDLPSSASRSMYTDTVGKVAWTSQVSSSASLTACYALARGDWRLPAVRNDRVNTFSLSGQFTLSQDYKLELGWSLDQAVSRVPATAGREFRRHQLTTGLQFAF